MLSCDDYIYCCNGRFYAINQDKYDFLFLGANTGRLIILKFELVIVGLFFGENNVSDKFITY